MEKTCKSCGESKPLDEYHNEKRGKYGKRSVCKVCYNAKSKAYRESPQGQATTKAYREKWYEENPDYNRRYYEENREHINELNRQWKIANPDYMPEYLAKYLPEYMQKPEVKERYRVQAHNRRNRLVGELPKDCLSKLIRRYGEACMNPQCGGEDSILTIDHVVPVSKGGANTMENVQILCYTCNRRKGNRSEADYRD
jgi:5-methylcytosine-specific restriction endonuclease McrA